MNIEEFAKEAAGNWQEFGSFSWHTRYDLEDPENFCIVYTSNRDSRLMDQSNEAAIEKEMAEFIGDDCWQERHSHWAVGYVDGYVIRVYDKDGNITPAFKKWCEIVEALEDYPVLDDDDYSSRELEATLENISSELHYVLNKLEDEGIEVDDEELSGKVFDWLWDNKQEEVESRDDQGGYPSKEAIKEAVLAIIGGVSENN